MKQAGVGEEGDLIGFRLKARQGHGGERGYSTSGLQQAGSLTLKPLVQEHFALFSTLSFGCFFPNGVCLFKQATIPLDSSPPRTSTLAHRPVHCTASCPPRHAGLGTAHPQCSYLPL